VEFVKPQRVNKAMTGHFKKAALLQFACSVKFAWRNRKTKRKSVTAVLVESFKAGELVDCHRP